VKPAIPDREYVRIENPISAERAVLRQSLISNLLDLTTANLRYRARVALFEIGPVFWHRAANETLLPSELARELPEDRGIKLPLERRRVGIALTGPRGDVSWQGANTASIDFYDFKGVVESLASGMHLANVSFAPSDNPLFHPGRGAEMKIGDSVIGEFGEVHPIVGERFDLPTHAALVGEFDLDALLAHVTSMYLVQALSRYPAVAQDLALIVDENVPADRVQALIVQTGGNLIERVTLFDVYRGDQIAKGKKSLAYAISFQANDRTLSDSDVTKVREKIVARLKREIDAEVRGA
jgi:phenylalanyl-tRNA synthetase beta chain